jgi:hypothetical protein
MLGSITVEVNAENIFILILNYSVNNDTNATLYNYLNYLNLYIYKRDYFESGVCQNIFFRGVGG